MKNRKPSGLTLTPLAIIIAVAAVVLGTELLFMVLLHEFLMPMFELPGLTWGVIDAVTLAAAIAPLLYFLVFRKIQESEERFRQINTAALDAIVIVNKQGVITGWNPAAQTMFQYSPEEALGQPMHQLIAPTRYQEDAARGFARFEETGGGPLIGKTTEIVALRKDGSEFPIELSISAVKLKNRWHAIGTIRDITERKRAEELLGAQFAEIKRARLDWRAMFDSISHPIFLHDRELRVIRANRAYTVQAGKPLEEIIGQPYYTIFPKSDTPLPGCLRAMEKAEEEEEEEEEEVAVGEATYRSRSFSVHDEQGAYLYSVHILEDITERKQAEAAFTALVGTAAANIGAAFFRETVRSLSAWLGVECVIIGELQDGKRVRALAMQLDGQAVEHYEYALPDTPCNNVASKGYCEYPEAVCQLFPSDKDLQDMGAEAYIGTPIRGKNGETLGILCAISRHKIVPSPMLKGVFEVIASRAGTEIERERAEKLLRNSETRLHAIIENLTEGIAVSDLGGQLLHFNRAALDLHGFATLDECRQHLSKFADTFEISAMDGTVLALDQWPLARVLRGESLRDLEVYVRHLQVGWKRIYSYGGTLVRNDGKPLLAVLSISDITGRKQRENETQELLKVATQSRQVMLGMIEDQKRADARLKQSQNQLLQSEKMASIGLLAAGVAHEINNPVGFVNSNLGTLKKYLVNLLAVLDKYEAAEAALGADNPLVEELRQFKKKVYFERIRKDVNLLIAESQQGMERVKKIVLDLKNFSRTESEDQWALADVHQCLESTLNVVWNELKYKCEVVKEYAALPKIQCLPSQLNQVFMNLLVNAAQAIEERGKITLRSGQEGELIWVEVSDTGKGIPPENIPRLFDPFFTTKPIGKGTGLGLSVSYNIVEKHHGRIEVHSEAGKGSTFRVWLPVRQPDIKAAA